MAGQPFWTTEVRTTLVDLSRQIEKLTDKIEEYMAVHQEYLEKIHQILEEMNAKKTKRKK